MMKLTFKSEELKTGKCTICGETSNAIVIKEDKCDVCFSASKFGDEMLKDILN